MSKLAIVKLSLSLVLGFFALSTSHAQQPARLATKEELIKEIFVLSKLDTVLQETMNNSCQMSVNQLGTQLDNILEELSSQNPERISALKERILKRFHDTCLSYTNAESLIQTLTPIYIELLSYDELVAFRDLNKEPIFQKMNQLTPVILQRFLESEQPKMEALYAKIIADIQTEFATLRQKDKSTPDSL